MPERADRFFSWVWRINGLVLLALGLVAGIGTVVLAANVALFSSRSRPEQHLTEIAGADLHEEDRLRLADFRPIAGTQILYATLSPPSEYIGSGSSGGLGRPRNLLFFDMRSKKAHWLIRGSEQTIHSYSFLMDPPRHDSRDDGFLERERKAVALLLELEPLVSEAGGQDHARSLELATADGRRRTSIAKSIDGLLGYHQSSEDTAFAFYASEGAVRVVEIDLVDLKARSDSLLSAQE